jgi:hypothetical protein
VFVLGLMCMRVFTTFFTTVAHIHGLGLEWAAKAKASLSFFRHKYYWGLFEVPAYFGPSAAIQRKNAFGESTNLGVYLKSRKSTICLLYWPRATAS